MSRYSVILVSIIFFCLQSCVKPPKSELEDVREDLFFDIKGFVKEQSDLLESRNKKLEKTLTIHGKTEETTPKDIDWSKEFTLIAESDINKPVLYDVYEIDSSESEITYTSKEAKQKVKKIIISKNGEEISRISIDFEEQNPIYHSARKMDLTVSDGLVSKFTIVGYQKVVTDDTLRYTLIDKVID